ncbi:hypothetical protein CTI14_66140, partial [Methylobacterium radiotolerans]
DNTAAFAAIGDALDMLARVGTRQGSDSRKTGQ